MVWTVVDGGPLPWRFCFVDGRRFEVCMIFFALQAFWSVRDLLRVASVFEVCVIFALQPLRFRTKHGSSFIAC